MTESEFLDEVARLLDIPRGQLRPEHEQGQVPGWDSIGHLNLLIGLSKTYGKALDPDRIADLTRLSDLYSYYST